MFSEPRDLPAFLTKCCKRREFITLLSGTTVIWPIAVRAQQREQIARIGVLMGTAAEDPEGQARITAFRQGLQKLGLTEGENVRIDVRWTAGDAALERKLATELVTLMPDVILATASPTVAALQAVTRTAPIVFAGTIDPVGAGFVDSLARPGSNATGFVLPNTAWARNDLGRHRFGVENLSEIMKIFEHSLEFDAAPHVWDVPNKVGELVNFSRYDPAVGEIEELGCDQDLGQIGLRVAERFFNVFHVGSLAAPPQRTRLPPQRLVFCGQFFAGRCHANSPHPLICIRFRSRSEAGRLRATNTLPAAGGIMQWRRPHKQTR
jgi:hypothetical protein